MKSHIDKIRKEERLVDIKELEKVSDFSLGEENIDYAPYFIGKSYLSLLNDKEVILNPS